MVTSAPQSNEEKIKNYRDRAKGYPPLERVGQTAAQITVGNRSSGDNEEFQKYAWSAIESRMIEASNRLYSILQVGKIPPGSLKSQLVEGLFAMFREHFDDPCCNRDGRLEALENRANHWKAQMGSGQRSGDAIDLGSVSHWSMAARQQGEEAEGEQDKKPKQLSAPTVDYLLHLWSEADATMTRIRIFGDKFGPGHVEKDKESGKRPRPSWSWWKSRPPACRHRNIYISGAGWSSSAFTPSGRQNRPRASSKPTIPRSRSASSTAMTSTCWWRNCPGSTKGLLAHPRLSQRRRRVPGTYHVHAHQDAALSSPAPPPQAGLPVRLRPPRR